MGILRFLFKTVVTLIIVLTLLVACGIALAIWSFPKIAPKIVDSWVQTNTSFSVAANQCDLKLFSGFLEFKGLRVFNPPYYQNKDFLDINQFYAKLNWASSYKNEVIFDEIFLDLAKITWVQRKDGPPNAIEFGNNLKKQMDSKRTNSSAQAALLPINNTAAPQNKTFLIKKLVIKLEKLDIVGFPDGGDSVQPVSVNYSREFYDVRNFDDVVKAVGSDLKALAVAALSKGLLTAPVKAVVDTLGDTAGSILKGGKGTGGLLKSLKILK